MSLIKLIGIDMDGTLLNSKGQVSERNKEAIRRASEKGVHVVVSTGRIYPSARFFARYTGLKTPIIASNGAVIKDAAVEEPLFTQALPFEKIKSLVGVADRYQARYHAASVYTMYTGRTDFTTEYYRKWNERLPEEEQVQLRIFESSHEFLQGVGKDVVKMVISKDDPESLKKMREEITEIGGLEVSSSWNDNLEVMKEGVNKGSGLSSIASYLGVDPQSVMAIGDNENDLSMIQYAGVGVAMGNGVEVVKKQADFITKTNDEDGVAYAIERFVLDSQSFK